MPATDAIPMMPEEYKGTVGQGCGYTLTKPRAWTEQEIKWVCDMRAQGYSNEQIATSTGRSAVSIQIKLKRIGKTTNTYNKNHINDKYACNDDYYRMVQPKTVLDLYCGTRSWWRTFTSSDVTTNDRETSIPADTHERAEMLVHRLYYEGHRYDVIDLDPYGSAYECFDLAIKMAERGIIITFGELGHRRWKRLDFVRRYYGIESMDDFTLPTLVDHVQQIAARNKKHLTPVVSRTWDRIARVWFTIEPLAITEQWETKE